MMSKMRTPLFAAVLVAVVALTGCGSDSDAKVEKKSDGSVVVKGPEGEVTASIDPDGNGGMTIKNGDDEITAGKGLPAGFPEDEIPIIDGNVVGGTRGNAGGRYAYTVLMQLDSSDPGAVLDEITSKLEGAGFRTTPGMTMNQMSTATFKSPAYEVGVNVVSAGGKITVTYVVKDA